ncbi:MAG: uracil-DNA glycosylase family protein [Candidatus Neomarinimicrobiota bacterium]
MPYIKSFDRNIRFHDLIESVASCSLCPRLSSKTKVLSHTNGSIDSQILFVAEAPGRLGADRTGVPLAGDQTGKNFESLLGNVGWDRSDIFITNAILCNPLDEKGNNGSPKRQEVHNCSAYLSMVMKIIDPAVVVTLGGVALTALNELSMHRMTLKTHLCTPTAWYDRIVFPLYHPGPRARIHRSKANQRADFMQLAKFVHPNEGVIRKPNRKVAKLPAQWKSPSAFQQTAYVIAHSLENLSYFKLTKLLYLSDLRALQLLGKTITGEIYLRQQEGPWPPKMPDQISALDGHELCVGFRHRKPFVKIGSSARFDVELSEEELSVIFDVVEQYGHLSNAAVKTFAYSTKPMKYILREEEKGRDLRKLPVIYKNQTADTLDSAKA